MFILIIVLKKNIYCVIFVILLLVNDKDFFFLIFNIYIFSLKIIVWFKFWILYVFVDEYIKNFYWF